LTVQKGSSSNFDLSFGPGNALAVTNGINVKLGGEIDVAASGASLKGASLNNSGTLTVNNGGTLGVTGGLANSSSMTVGSGGGNGTVSVGGTFANTGGVLNTLQVNGG